MPPIMKSAMANIQTAAIITNNISFFILYLRAHVYAFVPIIPRFSQKAIPLLYHIIEFSAFCVRLRKNRGAKDQKRNVGSGAEQDRNGKQIQHKKRGDAGGVHGLFRTVSVSAEKNR
jgi:hypothetical protein